MDIAWALARVLFNFALVMGLVIGSAAALMWWAERQGKQLTDYSVPVFIVLLIISAIVFSL
jgi:hypothetical protein